MSGGPTTPLPPLALPLGPSPYYLSGSDTETTPTGLAGLRVKPSRKLSGDEKEVYREMRRQSHISAEQKRRGSIKVCVCVRGGCVCVGGGEAVCVCGGVGGG